MPKQKPVIVVTGASGFLGSELVRHFSEKGWQVRALVRQVEQYQSSGSVTYIDYDLTKQFDEAAIFKGADYLVHTAYIKDSRQQPDALDINVAGAEALLAASRKYHLKRNVFISTMSAHTDAVSVYGKQKLAIEARFNTPRDTVLRSGLIIGNGGIVKQMALFMKSKHLVPLVGGGKQPLQTIAVYDLAGIIERVTTAELGGLYTVATPTVYTYRKFYKTLANHLGISVLFVPVPFPVLMAGLQLIALLHLPLGVSKDNALGLKKLISVDTAPDLQLLGVKLDPLEKALRKSNL